MKRFANIRIVFLHIFFVGRMRATKLRLFGNFLNLPRHKKSFGLQTKNLACEQMILIKLLIIIGSTWNCFRESYDENHAEMFEKSIQTRPQETNSFVSGEIKKLSLSKRIFKKRSTCWWLLMLIVCNLVLWLTLILFTLKLESGFAFSTEHMNDGSNDTFNKKTVIKGSAILTLKT